MQDAGIRGFGLRSSFHYVYVYVFTVIYDGFLGI